MQFRAKPKKVVELILGINTTYGIQYIIVPSKSTVPVEVYTL